jgi:NADH-quinone oxidoreductase subunit C
MMDGELQNRIVAAIKEKFADEILHSAMLDDFLTVTLKKEKVIDIIRHLYHHPEMKFQYLTTLCGIHYPELQQIAVMYQLHNLYANVRLRLKVYLPESNPAVATLTTVFKAANWMERETYDFYGVNFIGHPNLKRILNVDEMTIFPLRKEYPLEDQVRQDKNDAMFGR